MLLKLWHKRPDQICDIFENDSIFYNMQTNRGFPLKINLVYSANTRLLLLFHFSADQTSFLALKGPFSEN